MKELVKEFPLDGDKNELLNKTDEPLKKIVVINFRGKQKTIKPRCEICAFCEIIEESENLDLLCLKKSQIIDDNHKCDEFNISRGMLSDIYHGCIE